MFFSGTVLRTKIPSQNSLIGNDRTTLTYHPPSVMENPKPTYDVIFLFDYGPHFEELFTDALNEIFAGTFSQDFVVIGFGDFKNFPSDKRDRWNLLTQVRKSYLTKKKIIIFVINCRFVIC